MPKTSIVSGDQIFDEMLGDINYDVDDMNIYPFKVRVGVTYRRPARHSYFEFIIDMGMMDIDRVFNKQPFTLKHLTFVFPERWMGVSEQREFMYCLNRHPDASKLERVDIITGSPIMVSDFKNEMIRILKWPDDSNYEHKN